MTEELSTPEEEKQSKTTSPDNLYDKELLVAEYTQAGEEFRYRDRLIHNSYYLLIIASFAFVGIAVREYRNGDVFTTSIIVIMGGVGYLLIGSIILNHFIQRRSAESLRTRTEQYAEGIQKEPVQRPLSIQYWVIGQDSEITDLELQESRTFWEELRTPPRNLYSAKTVAVFVFWSGLLLIVGGLLLLITV